MSDKAKEADRRCAVMEHQKKLDDKGKLPTVQLRCQRNKVILRSNVFNFYDSSFKVIYTQSPTDRIEIGDILEASNGVETFKVEKVCPGNIARYIIAAPINTMETVKEAEDVLKTDDNE